MLLDTCRINLQFPLLVDESSKPAEKTSNDPQKLVQTNKFNSDKYEEKNQKT